MKKGPKFDSHCVECKKPCMAPRGNFNANRVSLCKSPKCRRSRKSALQREARKQKELLLPAMPTPTVRGCKVRKPSKATKAERKRKFFSQVV